MDDEIPASHRRNNNSSDMRFLGKLDLPESDTSSLELQESDVVWSGDFSDASNRGLSPESSPGVENTRNGFSVHVSPASCVGRRRGNSFKQEKSGLSAALSGENRLLVQRKAALDPLISVARNNVPPPVPVPSSRPGSGSDDFSVGGGRPPGKYHQSAPVNVPVWSKVNRHPVNPPTFVEEDNETDDEMLPPHLFVEREIARSHMTTFSVFEGVGRTLKGRDLRRVRNAVFQKTGFLD